MHPVKAHNKEPNAKKAPKGTKSKEIYKTDVMGNKLWDFTKNKYKTKFFYESISSYDVASVHMQSSNTEPDRDSKPTKPAAAKPESAGAKSKSGTSGAKSKPETKPKVSFAQKALLSPQGNKSTANNDDVLPNDNRKRRKCCLCEGPHTN